MIDWKHGNFDPGRVDWNRVRACMESKIFDELCLSHASVTTGTSSTLKMSPKMPLITTGSMRSSITQDDIREVWQAMPQRWHTSPQAFIVTPGVFHAFKSEASKPTDPGFIPSLPFAGMPVYIAHSIRELYEIAHRLMRKGVKVGICGFSDEADRVVEAINADHFRRRVERDGLYDPPI